MNLKSLLEGYAWERKADGSLPTLADATATHAKNMQETKNSLNENLANIGKQLKTLGFQLSTTPGIGEIDVVAHKVGGSGRFLTIIIKPGGYYYGILRDGSNMDVINGVLDDTVTEPDRNLSNIVTKEVN